MSYILPIFLFLLFVPVCAIMILLSKAMSIAEKKSSDTYFGEDNSTDNDKDCDPNEK